MGSGEGHKVQGLAAGMDIQLPYGYFKDDDPAKGPLNNWRTFGYLMFSNWINQVYQSTFYDIDRIGCYED